MKYTDIIKFLLGIALITFIFWNRIIRIRSTQEFSKIISENMPFYIISSGFCLLLFTLLFLYTVKIVLQSNHNDKPYGFFNNTYYLKLQATIKTYIIDAPQYVYEVLTKNLNLAPFIEYPASLFSAHFAYPKTFVIMFYFLPQISISLVFFIETCFFHQRIIFIKMLSLLILLLVMKIIIFIFKNYSERRLKRYDLYFDIMQTENGITHVSLKPPHLLPQHIPLEDIVNNYNTMYLYWVIYSHIHSVMLSIEDFDKKYRPYAQIITFFFFTLGWLYFFLFLIYQWHVIT